MATLLSSPSTPSSHRTFTTFGGHTPSKSSPLTVPADSSPILSPTPTIQDRRRSQYKSMALTSPTINRTRPTSRRVSSHPAPPSRPDLFGHSQEATGKQLLRERFKARCLERALKERERKIVGKRRASDWSSDGPDEMMDFDDDDEDEEESMLNDTFFSRIMASAQRKQHHSYRVSYSQEVGSSFDPDMEDPAEWEHELREETAEEIPDDLDDEELAAYAAERELLEGLTEEDIFSYSDIEDISQFDDDEPHSTSSQSTQPLRPLDNGDVEMDM
ncbi:hypothetical protein BDY19DRAFT_1048377 [Irpex rosettiformis]|uniref:Uncharacterized protein n=1 Tax=Irpex rosettiformis TaxID=378272 RepID=A0ACB8U3J4_9APHY|nr:hypothetical protein BDY19DRAFT_1048377 [Irpex rosettiformis]